MNISKIFSDDPITPIDITKLKERRANWLRSDQQQREQAKLLKPPAAKKVFLQEFPQFNIEKEYCRDVVTKKIIPIPVEIETDECVKCTEMISKGTKYCSDCKPYHYDKV